MLDKIIPSLIALVALVPMPVFAGQGASSGRRIHWSSDTHSNRPNEEEWLRAYSQGKGKAEEAFGRKDFKACRIWCQTMLLDNPDDSSAASLLADAYLHEGKYRAAYEVITPFVQKESDSKVLLRAALVADLLGEKHEGMEAYCRRAALRDKSDRDPKDWNAISLPKTGAKGATALCAALALSDEFASTGRYAWNELYTGIALRLDSTNPIANLTMAEIDINAKRLAAARVHFGLAMQRGNPSLRDWAKERLRYVGKVEAKERAKSKPPSRARRP